MSMHTAVCDKFTVYIINRFKNYLCKCKLYKLYNRAKQWLCPVDWLA